MNELVVEAIIQFCRYCKQPSQQNAHSVCELSFQQWQKDSFDMKEFWEGFLWNELRNKKDNIIYYGFLPYLVSELTMEEGFKIVDQQLYADSYLHYHKHCYKYTDFNEHVAEFGCCVVEDGNKQLSAKFISEFWKDSIRSELLDFTATQKEIYLGFLPYTTIVGLFGAKKFIIEEDQEGFTELFLRDKYGTGKYESLRTTKY